MTEAKLDGLYIGLMSGTSLDGIDCSLVSFDQDPPRSEYSITIPFSDPLRRQLTTISRDGKLTLIQLGEINANLAIEYANAIDQCVNNNGVSKQDISAIGCHGQTVWHSPDSKPPFTIQLGDPGKLSALTNLPVVADFRRKDIALGGQGAPLAPAFHNEVFRSPKSDRIILNLGGIANITLLPSNPDQPVSGFDTGPANTLLDNWINKTSSIPFDHNGEWASSGQINMELLDRMLSKEPYFSSPAPKTTGTEYFSRRWLDTYTRSSTLPAQDIQATLVELTVTTIANDIKRLNTNQPECFVCGGGASNDYLMQRLKQKLAKSTIATTASLGVDPNFVEAIAFAWLAKQTLNGLHGNLPSVTHASRAAILGGIYWP